MPKHKIYLGKIKNASSMMEMVAKRPEREKTKPMQVKFEGEWKAMLHLDYPVATVWARMLDYLQKNNRPVYVEIDNDTDIITKLYIPIAAKVSEIISSDENVVYYIFTGSHARHHLRRNLPDFQKFLDALQVAKDTDTKVLVTATPHEFEIIDVRPVPPSFGIDGPSEPPPPPPPDPPVSPQRATDLFNMMNAETCTPCSSSSPCIPFKYPVDGCWIRAHLMCYLMTAEAETPEKVWIKGSLVVPSSNVHTCEVTWGWHVAPTLMVTQPSGPDIKMVIDPSLSAGPITTTDWKGLQGDPSATLYFTPWQDHYYYDVYTNTVPQPFATVAEADNDMEGYRLSLDSLCTTYGPSPYACPIVKNCFFIVDRSTISKDEVDAMLVISNPAVIEAAFYVAVDGFTPSELGITNATLSGIPNIKPTLTPTPSVSQMTIEVMATIKLEDTVHLNRRQRITWKYKISFTGSAGFVNELEEINLAASISTVSGNGKIYLIKQPNPYEIDGEVSWLSTDLRVFQIKAGDSLFNKQMLADAPNFITDMIQNLNTGNTGGQTFDNNISTDQQTSKLELSQSVGGAAVYNFAVAKVRYRAVAVSATNVRVFFRLFPASSTSLEYNQTTTYRRNTAGGTVTPLLGIINGEAVTIPCFAAPRIISSSASMTTQTDAPNVQTIPPNAGGNEVVRYFGCWLDINQTTPQFPFNPLPIDGPWTSGRQSVQEHVRNEHQCLVAEIAFDPTPIPLSAYPSTSDKLAQRNLAIVQSANPGDFASHRIPHTFEIKPTRTRRSADDELPDELMIDWENIPVGCLATIYISGANTNDILSLAAKTYRSHGLVRVDANTLQCETGGMTYIPIPAGEGSNFPAMLSIDLPVDVKKGQVFTVVVHQITSSVRSEILTHATARHRRILGSFQITIPVTIKENMLVHEEILLSNLRWIQRAIPENNRWFPVFNRYVKQIGNRVDALGGDSDKVAASPSGDWKIRYRRCLVLRIIATVLLAAFVIVSGSLSGQSMIIAGSLAIALLLFVTYYWITNCKPGICSLLKTVLFGVGSGAVVLALLLLVGVSALQLIGVLVTSILITALAALICWRRHCFK
jgi:hypothetical protein